MLLRLANRFGARLERGEIWGTSVCEVIHVHLEGAHTDRDERNQSIKKSPCH
jgi:hypothetical protein